MRDHKMTTAAAALALADPAIGPAVAAPYVRREYGQKKAEAEGNADALETKLDALLTKFGENQSKVEGLASDVRTQLKARGDAETELKGKLDEVLTKGTDLDARIQEIEQRLAKRAGGGSGGDAERKSLGAQLVESDQFKGMTEKGWDGEKLRFKLQKAVTSNPASAGDLIVPQRLDGIIAGPDRQPTVRSLIMPGTTDSNAIQYVKETGFTNNAAIVAEGGQKPKSDLTFELETVAVQTIAHLLDASRQILADAPMLRSYVDGRLTWGLNDVLDQQLLYGDGTASNLHGIVPQASEFDPEFETAENTLIDQLRLAMLQVRLAKYRSTGHVLNAVDWARIELTKTTDGAYIFANPQRLAGPVLWGLPVIDSDGMEPGEFLTGAFRMAAQYFEREDIDILVSESNKDNFEKNMVTLRAELRGALAVFRPEAFVTGQFTIAAPPASV